MSLPKEPRQKMINLMYLVLTALLALNVSSEILNAFKVVNNSLGNSNQSIDNKNQLIFKSFQDKLADATSKETAEIWFPKAKKAKDISEELFQYLESLKQQLKEGSHLQKINGEEHFAEDNLDAASRIFIEGSAGKTLLQRLTDYKLQLLGIDPEVSKEFATTLPLDLTAPKSKEGKEQPWEYGYFHMTPTIAAITILSKFQNDVRNSEAKVVEFCHSKIGEVKVKYDQFKAIASGNATYLMPEEEMIITAGIGAFSSAAKPNITVDGAPVTNLPDGSSEYKFKVGGPGSYQKTVKIVYTDQQGKQAIVDKVIKYTVGVPSGLTVSTDKTRVFYQYMQNPLSITGGGGDEKIQVQITGPGVSFSKSGAGQYIVSCNELGTATVIASDGKGNPTKINIPIKRVPPPLPQVGNLPPGDCPYNRFKSQRGVFAFLKDFVFEGIEYKVSDFIFTASGKGFEEVGVYEQEVNGSNAFSPDIIKNMEKLQSGSNVTISSIKAIGPGGKKINLESNITYLLTD